MMLRAGGDAWITGSYDAELGLTYWGVAQAKPWSQASRTTDGDALYTSSTLALDPETGEMKWYYQHIPGESHDMDEVFERVLVDVDGRASVFTVELPQDAKFAHREDRGPTIDVDQHTFEHLIHVVRFTGDVLVIPLHFAGFGIKR
jgi:hypothetical protein